MNILTDSLPHSLTIDGREYEIDGDFRTCLRIILAYESNDLTPQEKQIVLLANLFIDQPADLQQALQQAKWFLDGGKDGEGDASAPRVYSFTKDADRIFAAFKQVHGIDLDVSDLHWWKFLALFQAVIADQDNAFGSLVTLRYRVKTGRASKEEMKAYRELGDMATIEEVDDRTLEEREIAQRFFEAVERAKQKQQVTNG